MAKRYFDIHVQFGKKDGDGYSIPIMVEGDKEDAVKKAQLNNYFEYTEDIDSIDYIEEISEKEYKEMICI